MIEQWQPPAEFDGYRLGRVLGRGAMGQVYLAHDTLLDRPVAVKFIASVHADADSRQRFFVEARAIARLQHPNVVTVYRVGEVAGLPYLVSEFVRGEGLDRIPKPVAWQRVLDIGMGLARGLAVAHRRGVLHRDIKPANAILSDDGEVKLLDFGLAKLVDDVSASSPSLRVETEANGQPSVTGMEATQEVSAAWVGDRVHDPGLTRAGSIMGTPLYMAPEVWRGEPATFRSDVYSLGALLYYLCAGVPPHREPDAERLRVAVLGSDARSLTEVVPGIDARLAAVVERCLKRDPAARYETGNDVRAALTELTPEARAGLIPEGNPYRGLRAFEAEHRALYFGRDAEIRAILERLSGESFVLIAGDSGVGKSSLCRAGILPRSGEGQFAANRTWSVVTLVPGRHPITSLAAALAPQLEMTEEALSRLIADQPSAVGRELRRRHGQATGIVIFIDQLEELVTLGDRKEVSVFAEVLGWLTTPTPGLRVLASVRGDFLSRVAALPGIGDITRSLYFLRPLSPERIREAVVGPALAKGVGFESERLVDDLVESTASAEGGLPLLQFALAQLWEMRDDKRKMIPASALASLGGVAGALTRHADDVIAQLVPAQRQAVRRILTALVTLKGTRTRRTEAELVGTDPAARTALDALVRGRLLVAREAPEGSAYEVAHEALLQSWLTLRQWLDEDADSRALEERLRVAVEEWDRLGRSSEALWSARQLADAVKVNPANLDASLQEFLALSQQAVRRRRLVRGAFIVGAPLLVAIIYAGFLVKARADLTHRIDAHVARARASLAKAEETNAAVERLRGKAFAFFDHHEIDKGEEVWGDARRRVREAEPFYRYAGQELEAALMLDASRRDARNLFGDILYRRAVIAEREHQMGACSELLQRLSLYDEGGERRRRWSASAQLSVRTSAAGAQVVLERYVTDEQQRRVPVKVRDLGATPVASFTVQPGSYRLLITAPGHADTRYPVFLDRGERIDLDIPLVPATSVPPGFVYVPPGTFLFGSGAEDHVRSNIYRTVPLHALPTGAYLIARHETTFAEWIEFLESLPLAERKRRTPTVAAGFRGSMRLRSDGGAWQLMLQPTTRAYQARAGERITYRDRAKRATQDWLRFPVTGISPGDAQAYVAWLQRTGRVRGARLCSEREWTRAARGADEREYPHGDSVEPDDANYDETYGKMPLAFGPDEVGAHPLSSSPFGVDDLAGNVWEWVSSSLGVNETVVQGGSYYDAKDIITIFNREVTEPTFRDVLIGMRVCADISPASSR